MPQALLKRFWAAATEALQERRVVSVFSRLHPLVNQEAWLSGLGEIVPLGQTVSIDLTLPLDEQFSQYRRGHRSDLRKLRRLGMTCFHDRDRAHLNEVVKIYLDTMQRVDAAEEYFYDQLYFDRLVANLEQNVQLFVCQLEDQVISGVFFLCCNGIVQAHLGGTQTEYLKLAPIKLVIDTARLWATEQGAHVLHLGGGVGSKEDSLFRFKTGFSDCRHQFAIWQWVLLPQAYDRLCRERTWWSEQRGLTLASDYFPAYRASTLAVQDEIEQA
jgi:hypothetical protein